MTDTVRTAIFALFLLPQQQRCIELSMKLIRRLASSLREAELKKTIGYHRSYRKIAIDIKTVIAAVVSLVVLLPILVFKAVFASDFTYKVTIFLQDFFSGHLPVATPLGQAKIGTTIFFFLDITPELPSTGLCLSMMGITLAVFLCLPFTRLPRPLIIFVNLTLGIVGFFAFLFSVAPQLFQLSGITVGEMFIQVSMIIWFILPIFFWMVLFPVPAGLFSKVLALLLFEASLMLIFVLKYAIFVLLCLDGTYLVVPLIIFFLCSLLDVIYMVGLFAVLMCHVSLNLSKQSKVWHWA